MKPEIAQLRQEHDSSAGTFSGEPLQRVQDVLFERRTQRIVPVIKRGGGEAIAPYADVSQQRQFIQIQPKP